jgi:hypothetical protein
MAGKWTFLAERGCTPGAWHRRCNRGRRAARRCATSGGSSTRRLGLRADSPRREPTGGSFACLLRLSGRRFFASSPLRFFLRLAPLRPCALPDSDGPSGLSASVLRFARVCVLRSALLGSASPCARPVVRVVALASFARLGSLASARSVVPVPHARGAGTTLFREDSGVPCAPRRVAGSAALPLLTPRGRDVSSRA